MKIILVTANLPLGTDEAFLIPEVDQMIRLGHQVLLVPRSSHGVILHGEHLLKHARCEPLLSMKVLRRAWAVALASPRRVAAAARLLFGGRAFSITLKNIAVLPKALWLADVAERWGADHIQCHWAGTTASMAMLASAISGIPWSFTAHRWDIVENNLLVRKTQSATLARFISEDGLRMAQTIGVVPGDRAQVLYMGVPIPPANPRLSGPKPVVLCPARLLEVKGHRYLIEAWRNLRQRGVEAELWIAGRGELRSRLEKLTETLGVAGSIRFLGALPHTQLLNLYRDGKISAVALASIDMGHGFHEGIPVALIEAMSYGVPVVATSTGGVPELILPGTGFLVPPRNSGALADALQNLLESACIREEIGDAGRRRVAESYDIAMITSALLTAMQSARAGARSPDAQFVAQTI